MTVARFAVSFDKQLASEVRQAAGDEPTSAWLADAARRKLRAQGLERVIRQWEKEHGELTAAELKAAERKQRAARRK
jgi:hypothetical protein